MPKSKSLGLDEESVDWLAQYLDPLRKANRKIWQWSAPRKACIKRATGADGFYRCEQCKEVVPKIFVDHIVAVGNMDEGFLRRLFCPPSGLRALCKRCHQSKTNEERKCQKRK
jgi:5-methylcytosine-specific restriction endonuclease McrA